MRAARPAARSASPTAASPQPAGTHADGSDGLVVVIGAGGRAGQPDCTPPISRSSSRALCACSGRHSTAYDDATIWLVDVKSRRPRENEYVSDREEQAERATDEDRGHQRALRARRGEQAEQEADEQAEPRARTGTRRAPRAGRRAAR